MFIRVVRVIRGKLFDEFLPTDGQGLADSTEPRQIAKRYLSGLSLSTGSGRAGRLNASRSSSVQEVPSR